MRQGAAHWLGGQLASPRGLGGWLVGQAMRLANREPIRLAVEALNPAPGDVALDLGCGPGEGVRRLASRVAHVHGVDASEIMIATARRANRVLVERGRVTLSMGRFDSVPLSDRCVDRILAVNVAYFWTDMAAVIAEIRRIIRPGGRLVLYVTEAETMRNWSFADPRTHRHFDVEGLRLALVGAGLEAFRIAIRRHWLPGKVTGLICTVDL